MTKRKEVWDRLFWATDDSWSVYDPSAEFSYRLTENAPPKARVSFEKWLAYRRAHPDE